MCVCVAGRVHACTLRISGSVPGSEATHSLAVSGSGETLFWRLGARPVWPVSSPPKPPSQSSSQLYEGKNESGSHLLILLTLLSLGRGKARRLSLIEILESRKVRGKAFLHSDTVRRT